MITDQIGLHSVLLLLLIINIIFIGRTHVLEISSFALKKPAQATCISKQ